MAIQLVSKIYCLPNNANAGTFDASATRVSGCTTGAPYRGTEAQITGANTVTITNATAGTYAAISTSLGTRSTVLVNRAGTTPEIYHISAKSGNDTSMTLTISEAPATDANNRVWAIGGPFTTLTDAGKAAVAGATTTGYDVIYASNEGGAAMAGAKGEFKTNSGDLAVGMLEVIGYSSTEEDDGWFTIDCNNNGTDIGIDGTVSWLLLKNIKVKNWASTGNGFKWATGTNIWFIHCSAEANAAGSATGAAFTNSSANVLWVDCMADCGGKNMYAYYLNGSQQVMAGCVARNGGTTSLVASPGGISIYLDCLIVDASGASAHALSTRGGLAYHCTIDGIAGASASAYNVTGTANYHYILNSILSNNNSALKRGTTHALIFSYCNDFYNTGVNTEVQFPQDGEGGAALLNYDLDPQYVDRTNKNFGIGTNLKEKAIPRAFQAGASTPVVATTNYQDIGAAQRQEPAASSTIYVETHNVTIGNSISVVPY